MLAYCYVEHSVHVAENHVMDISGHCTNSHEQLIIL